MYKLGYFWALRGHSMSSEISTFDRVHATSYSTSIETVHLSFEIQRVICLKLPILTHPTCIWRPHRGLHLVEFHGDFWRQESRLCGLSSGVAYLILIFYPFLVEHRPLTDRQTQAHSICRTSIASRSKNKPLLHHSAVLITKHSICFSQYHTDD